MEMGSRFVVFNRKTGEKNRTSDSWNTDEFQCGTNTHF